MSLEDTLKSWSQPPSDTEQTKADNAERIIREALRNDRALANHTILVETQGSYKANTNVRLNSDVDICILCSDVYFYDLTFSDLTVDTIPGGAPSLTYPAFRNMVESALVARFGRSSVTRGNKAFDVHANTYRLDADVITAFEFRRFHKRGPRGEITWEPGIAFITDQGVRIENWPQQTYENGVAKNTRTGKRYKSAIRILKRLRDNMQDRQVAAAKDIGSFLLESLAWNVPDDRFASADYSDVIRNILAHTFNNTMTDEKCDEWGEVNELKYLFRGTPSLRQKVNGFLDAGWNTLGFN